MPTASKRIPQGRGLAAALLARAATIELDWDTRQKSRFQATDSKGREIAVFLPRGQAVRGGDVLVADDGSLLKVAAAPQTVLAVRSTRGPLGLLRAAYHLGNRHVALEVGADRLQLEPDPVLAEMLGRMGLEVDQVQAPFEPEAGAYSEESGAHRHSHGHVHEPAPAAGDAHGCGHGHDHAAHGHVHGHAHDHAHGKAQGHANGHAHDHDHDHDHRHGHPAPQAAGDADPARRGG